MLPHCAINRPKKNQVDFCISQVKLDTPTIQTAIHTIHNLCGKGGNALRDNARTPSKAQKTAKPITPCSTRTDKKVLCAGCAGSCSSRRIGSAKTRQTISRKAFAPMPKKGCARKISQPALQMTVRPVYVPCVSSLGIVDRRSHEVEGTKRTTPYTSKDTVTMSAIRWRLVKRAGRQQDGRTCQDKLQSVEPSRPTLALNEQIVGHRDA